MQKKLLSLIACTGLITPVFAYTQSYQQWQAIRTNPECQPELAHMRASHQKIEEAIAANDANTVGKLVIADHNYREAFMAKNPQCKFPYHKHNSSGLI